MIAAPVGPVKRAFDGRYRRVGRIPGRSGAVAAGADVGTKHIGKAVYATEDETRLLTGCYDSSCGRVVSVLGTELALIATKRFGETPNPDDDRSMLVCDDFIGA